MKSALHCAISYVTNCNSTGRHFPGEVVLNSLQSFDQGKLGNWDVLLLQSLASRLEGVNDAKRYIPLVDLERSESTPRSRL